LREGLKKQEKRKMGDEGKALKQVNWLDEKAIGGKGK